ncbi:MAG: hypothetical protein EOP61_32520, partial [Sphingomonadales bacterium]
MRRRGRQLLILIVGMCLAVMAGFTIYAVSALPTLQPWHTEILSEEFSARRDGDLDFAGYLKLEGRLFAEMRAKEADWDRSSEAYIFSRFDPASPANRLADGAPYNRSFRLLQPNAIGHAL